MKIGIITIHKSSSYGGSLQSFALFQFLKDKGYNVEIIDLLRPCHQQYKYSRRHFRTRDRIIDKIRAIISSFTKYRIYKINSDSYNKNFLLFNNRLNLSRMYRNIDELYKSPPDYDIYITGSDQVWNPIQLYLIEPYFLTFVKKEKCLKISFAASIGISELLPKEKKLFKKWLENYDYISVREKEMQTYLSKFIDKKIYRVADPTFLLDRNFWKELANEPSQKNPYILLFELSYNRNLIEFCSRLAKESGYKLIVLGQEEPTPPQNEYCVVNTAGPDDFIGYIKDAEMVITDSFHGTVFSIIMECKNFYTYIAPGNLKSSRITDLLNSFDVSDHLLNNSLNQEWKYLVQNQLNKERIDRCYINEQTLSRKFLDNSIDYYSCRYK